MAIHSFCKAAIGIAWSLGLFIIGSRPVYAGADAEFDSARLQFDNDLFAGQHRDRDYTGGLVLTLSGERAAGNEPLSLDRALSRIDQWVTPPVQGTTHFARQFGFMAFSPVDITQAQPLPDDRPYASLLFVANGRLRVESDARTAWFSSFSVGVLGLPLAASMHNAVHEAVGSERARGYRHQIAAGGEPTAKYTLAHQYLLVANPSGTLDVKTTLQGSVGYLTETSAALSMRFGRFGSSWWSVAPELTDYTAAPLPMGREFSRPEFYLYAGVRLKARAYNAFLQGQLRDSAVRYSHNEIEPFVAQAWIGLVNEVVEHTQVSYTLNYQSAELRQGKAARDSLWGALQITRSF